MKKVLITGGAGFIGYFLSQKLLVLGLEVVGIDDLNDYYDPALKQARLDQLSAEPKYSFIKLDIADRTGMERLFMDQQFDIVVNMAAQAGVRYSRVIVKSGVCVKNQAAIRISGITSIPSENFTPSITFAR